MSNEMIVSEALVNKKTGEVVEIGLQKTPKELLLDAKDAASALQSVIDSNKTPPLMFRGKRYLEFPHWQTIGAFYHCSATSGSAVPVEIAGITGFKAIGEIIDIKTGMVVGRAEAYCMRDEEQWKYKPLSQLASMAQTRAASKALSNKFRYVAIVAGYEPTPAEEIDGTTQRKVRIPEERKPSTDSGHLDHRATQLSGDSRPGHAGLETVRGETHLRSDQEATKPLDTRLITSKQRAFLFARCKQANIPEALLKSYLLKNYGLEHTDQLNRTQLDSTLQWITDFQDLGEQPADEIPFGEGPVSPPEAA